MSVKVLLCVGGKIQMRNMRVTLADAEGEIYLFCIDEMLLTNILRKNSRMLK